MTMPQSGYTLPVFCCAAAIAALHWLQESTSISTVAVDLLEPAEVVDIAIEQVAGLFPGAALAITRSEPGDNLDLTRQMPIWALVEWAKADQPEPIRLQAGEGIGRHTQDGRASIYTYARRLIHTNLARLLQPGERIQVTLILPDGRQLADRTSNAAFGIIEGLSLLGTSGIAHALTSPEQLHLYQEELRQKADRWDCLVFCIGENGLDLARQLGIAPDRLIKTANWLGPMLVEAGLQGIASILLLGYHGKLIKLAGAIFHTHHSVADARLEILTAHAAQTGLPHTELQTLFQAPTTEAGLQHLRHLDATTGSQWVSQIYGAIATAIDTRAQAYIQTHSAQSVQVGTILFDRQRQIIIKSKLGEQLLDHVC